MSVHIERVKVADIHPLVDEYGNEFASRDYSLEVNKQYVRELAESFGPNGEPDEEVKLVRDGDVYRIKAGNSRVRAMKELGTEWCNAVIDDDDTVQSVLETVVRTNVKKKYEPVEESGFVQQLFLFGDDQYVGDVSMIGQENASKMRRAVAMAGDRAGQMSLDQLYAISEFEEYPEMAEKIMSADATSWRGKYEAERRNKRKIESKKNLVAEAEKLKMDITEERPPSSHRYIAKCWEPGDLSGTFMAARVKNSDIIARIIESWDCFYLDLYGVPLDAEKESAEEAERRRKVDEAAKVLKSIDDDMLEWVRDNLDRPAVKQDTVLRKMPSLVDAAFKMLKKMWYVKDAESFVPSLKGRDSCGLLDFVIGYKDMRCECAYYASDIVDSGALDRYTAKKFESIVKLIDMHVADGWKPNAEQEKAIKKMKARLQASEGGEK